MMNISHVDLLTLIGQDTPLKRVASTDGGEFAGPCPWCGGEDRFRVWPHRDNPGYWCRQCNRTGNAVRYVMERDNIPAREAMGKLGVDDHGPARKPSRPPRPLPKTGLYRTDWEATTNLAWQQAAGDFVKRAIDTLHSPRMGQPGLDYLSRRGLNETTAAAYKLGYNLKSYEGHWGVSRVYFPAQTVILPWYETSDESHGRLLKVKYRSVFGKKQFSQATGSANGLYGWPKFHPRARVILVESELCALSIWQVASHLVVPLATGSVSGGRLSLWVARLARASQRILAFDNDDDGQRAEDWWSTSFPDAICLKPSRHDVNDMLTAGDDIVTWLKGALASVEDAA